MFLCIGFTQEQISFEDCEKMVREHDYDAIKKLINNPQLYSSYATPPILLIAIREKDYKLIQFMFNQGMSFEYYWDGGYTYDSYLEEPIASGDYKMVKYLLDYCKITNIDAGLAIIEGRIIIVELFIEKGFDFNKTYMSKTWAGMPVILTSFFCLAIENEQYYIAKMIFNNNDINSIFIFDNASGGRIKKTALDLANKNKDKSIVPWLINNGAKTYNDKVKSMSFKQLYASKDIEYLMASITDYLRIRSEPRINSEILGNIHTGDEVGVLCTNEEQVEIDGMTKYWYYICTKDGIKGWVFGGYMEYKSK